MADPTPVTTVKFMAGWREWRAECTCPWIGSYFACREDAEREAARHAAEHKARNV